MERPDLWQLERACFARGLTRVGRLAGKRCAAVITDMDQPLGCAVGNALEVKEAISVLKGETKGELLELCLTLGACILTEAGFAAGDREAREMLQKAIDDGSALKKLAEELRYSDPVSSAALTEIERDLSAAVEELQAAVIDADTSAVKHLCRKASALLAERSRLCKLNKT